MAVRCVDIGGKPGARSKPFGALQNGLRLRLERLIQRDQGERLGVAMPSRGRTISRSTSKQPSMPHRLQKHGLLKL